MQRVGAGDAVPAVRDFSAAELEQRYAAAARKEENRIARRGRGVSETAQKLFDYLHKK